MVSTSGTSHHTKYFKFTCGDNLKPLIGCFTPSKIFDWVNKEQLFDIVRPEALSLWDYSMAGYCSNIHPLLYEVYLNCIQNTQKPILTYLTAKLLTTPWNSIIDIIN